MILFAKALLGITTEEVAYEPIISKLSTARATITKPENYMSSDSDYSVIEAQATSTSGSRYVYVYPKDEYKDLFAEGEGTDERTVVVSAKEPGVAVVQYGTNNSRFALGNLTNVPSGTYHFYIYNNKTQKNIFEIELIWTNNI